MASTSIEWTEATWNPLTGCTKISPGCHSEWGGTNKKKAGRILEGRTWDEKPAPIAD